MPALTIFVPDEPFLQAPPRERPTARRQRGKRSAGSLGVPGEPLRGGACSGWGASGPGRFCSFASISGGFGGGLLRKTATCEYMLHFCAKIHIRPCSVRKSLPYKLVTRPPSGGTRRDLKRRGAVVQKIRMGNFFLHTRIWRKNEEYIACWDFRRAPAFRTLSDGAGTPLRA